MVSTIDPDGLGAPDAVTSLRAIKKNSTGEEDDYKIDHLSGKQLATNAKIVLRNTGHTKDVDSEISNIQTISNIGNHTGTAYPSEMCTNNYSWVNGDLDLRYLRFPASNYSHLVNKTCYAQFKNCPKPNISSDAPRSVIAILILSGDNRLPDK
ncbi:hypothetical protein ILUMI_00460 [Ignelater luminosus]|uniref:Uncharacterized protein n=1 Tax=Ignelater luminosus TaxID=2038154 RepID=A0A8K0GID9_IGNLU|nr:hypothetical protein ILUMI_00460 [Ignelater luminosus]